VASRAEQFAEQQRKRAAEIRQSAMSGNLNKTASPPPSITSRSDAFRQNAVSFQPTPINELKAQLPPQLTATNPLQSSTLMRAIQGDTQAQDTYKAATGISIDPKPLSQYEIEKAGINNSDMPAPVKGFANTMNWVTRGNPVGRFLSRATTVPGVSVNPVDSTGSPLADKAAGLLGDYVAPVLVPSGAPIGGGVIGAPYQAAEQLVATKAGQKAVNTLANTIPKASQPTAQAIAKGAVTEGIAGVAQAPAGMLMMGESDTGDLLKGAAIGGVGGALLGGAFGGVGSAISRSRNSRTLPIEGPIESPIQAAPKDITEFPVPSRQPNDVMERITRGAELENSRQPEVKIPEPVKNRSTKLEDIVKENGFNDVNPETIAQSYNNKTWYHGTGKNDLTPDTLDPFVGSHESLFGHGVYLTDDVKIAGGYANNRGRRTSTPTIYQAQIKVDRVLDLEKPPTPDVSDVLFKSVKEMDQAYSRDIGEDFFTSIVRDSISKGKTTEAIILDIRKGVSEVSRDLEIPTSEFVEDFQNLAINLKLAGYDGLTHTGGLRTGNDPHRVMIVLDPQNAYGNNGVRQVSSFDKYVEPSNQSVDPITGKEPILRPNQFDDDQGLGISAFGKRKAYDSLSKDTRSQLVTRLDREQTTLKGVTDRFYTSIVDDLHPLNKFDKLTEDVLGQALKDSDSPYKLALGSRGSDVISKQIVTDQMVDAAGNAVGKSLKDIMSRMPKKAGRYGYVDFEDYLLNKHAITRAERGEKVFRDELEWTPQKGAQKVAEFEQMFPEFREMADDLYEFNRNMVNHWLVDTGMITREQAQAWFDANPYYVPNKRHFTDLEKGNMGVGGKSKKGFANQSNPVKQYGKGGSQRKIISPIESTIENVDAYVKTAKRNQVMQQLVRNIEQDPEAFSAFAEIVKRTDTDDILKQMSEEGIDSVIESLETGFNKANVKLDKDNIVRVLIGGKPVHVKINDKYLLEAITALGPENSGAVMNAIGRLTNTMKVLTTGSNPIFSFTRNLFRDIPQAYIASKTTNNPVTFAMDLISAAVDIGLRRGAYKEFLSVGGGHSSSVAANRNLLGQSKRAILPSKGPLKGALPKAYNMYENAMNAVETAPRLAEFKRTAKESGDLVEALFEAQDVTTNFKRHGTLTKELDKIFPYFNAAIQGMDQVIRVYKDNPVQALTKSALALSVPSMVLYAVNHDDPNYQKLNNRTKDAFFLVPKGDGTFIKIAKPQEQGTIFADLPERMMRLLQEEDPAAFRDFADRLRTTFLPPMLSGAAKSGGLTDRMLGVVGDTIAGPIADVAANKNFADAPIVPGYLQNLSPELQYDAKTTNVAKWIGEKTNTSPKQLDYLARQYTGVLGQIGQPLLSPGGDLGSALSQQMTADPVFSNDISTEFYKYKEKLDQAYTDRDLKELPTWYDDRVRKAMGKISSNMSSVRKEIRSVQGDKSLSNEEKRQKLRELQDQINQMAEEGNSLARGKVPY